MTTSTSKIGNKGEMYLPVQVRKELDLRPGTKVKFIILPNGKLYIEKIPTLEDIKQKGPLVKVSVDELEQLSEEMQTKMIEE
ncbi:MAG: AbrB/MazE/SpoVT family DNA-binding domain-containing protein [Candidatus Heimdallarchaeota archaeon]|nr:AbrB/MazE/SpoVT family DNA-binding domain-containing protein [Candidatus Heimdallarchaeota archaeon]